MVKNGQEEAPKLIAVVKEVVGTNRKVLCVCHKAVEPHLAAYGGTFEAFDVGHWNALDGRNDWQDYDTAVRSMPPSHFDCATAAPLMRAASHIYQLSIGP
jgi:hypothetical protein